MCVQGCWRGLRELLDWGLSCWKKAEQSLGAQNTLHMQWEDYCLVGHVAGASNNPV